MSLPKRDGVHDRYYLIHKPDTSLEVLAEADLCIQDVLNGTARENHSAYPTVVRNHNGTPFLPDQLLERYLTGLPLKGFPCEDAASLCDAMRRLVGWQEIRYTLEKYIEKQVQERYFEAGEKEDDFTPYTQTFNKMGFIETEKRDEIYMALRGILDALPDGTLQKDALMEKFEQLRDF